MSAEHVEARPGAYADSVTLMRVSADVRRADGVQAALDRHGDRAEPRPAAGDGVPAAAGAGPNHLLIAVRASGQAALSSALAAVDAALIARPSPSPAGRARAGHPVVSHPGAADHRRRGAGERSGPGADLGAGPVRVRRGDGRARRRLRRHDLLRQRAGRAGDRAQGRRRAARPARDGPGLRDGHRRRRRARLLAHARRRAGRARRRVRDRRAAGAVPAGLRGRRDQRRARRRRPRPVCRGRRPVGPRRARRARRRSGHRAHRRGVQAAGPGRSRRGCATTRRRWRRRCSSRSSAPGEPDLTAATEAALRSLGLPVPAWPRWPGPADRAGPNRQSTRPAAGRAGRCAACSPAARSCDEAMVIATGAARADPVEHPAAAGAAARAAGPVLGTRGPARTGHAMIDFGDDELTAGRAHPMIDQSLRIERLAAEAADPAVAVVLLDVVLGHGAHPDPAAELGPAIAAATRAQRGSGRRRLADRRQVRPAGTRTGRRRRCRRPGRTCSAPTRRPRAVRLRPDRRCRCR